MLRSLLATVVIGACAVASLPAAPSTSGAPLPSRLDTRSSRSARGLGHKTLRLRGGSEAVEAPAVDQVEEAVPVGFAAQLYKALHDNKSLDPNDHPSSLQWALAVLLATYIAVGAPCAQYIPGLKELTTVEPKEVPLTKAQIERQEREALRKEQEEEFEQTLMEDRAKQALQDAKQAKIDAARKEIEDAENAKNNAMAGYNEHIEAAKARVGAEATDGVLLRLRCPDGLQLTRKFAKDDKVLGLYDYIDVERNKKAAKAPDAQDKLLELAKFEYNLVCTMPKKVLADKEATLEAAGIKSSCALMVQPIVKADV